MLLLYLYLTIRIWIWRCYLYLSLISHHYLVYNVILHIHLPIAYRHTHCGETDEIIKARTSKSHSLACDFGLSRLYFTCNHHHPACISPFSWHPVYPCVDLYLVIYCNRSTDCMYPALFHCIQLYPYPHLAVSSGCIPLYLNVSHYLENGIWPNVHSGGGLTGSLVSPLRSLPRACVWRRAGLGARVIG